MANKDKNELKQVTEKEYPKYYYKNQNLYLSKYKQEYLKSK